MEWYFLIYQFHFPGDKMTQIVSYIVAKVLCFCCVDLDNTYVIIQNIF